MELEGWGRYPRVQVNGNTFETKDSLSHLVQSPGSLIPYGMGRSYGDSALNDTVIFTKRYNKLLDFNEETGVVTCESGVTLYELIEIFLPRGLFLSVTPGTKFVTVGGAIASDVHGKNHHTAGCFSESVISFDLMLADGSICTCSREENQELFLATCGGMGLTGIILSAVIQLKTVKSAFIRETVVRCRNLEEIFEQFEKNKKITYSVAWIDCLAKGENIGKSVLMAGENADTGTLNLVPPLHVSVPFSAPSVCLNKLSISMLNYVYYHISPDYVSGRLTALDTFFYPLDRVGNWNLLYGRKGFTQYQVVLPKASSFEGLKIVLQKIAAAGMGSFLAVLKLFGKNNENYLSFPMEGYTLALDFKIQAKLFPFLDELDKVVVDHGGRIYLTKDVRMKKEVFRKCYPQWEAFRAIREKYNMDEKFQSLQSKRLGV